MNNILILAILGFGIYIYMKNKENSTGAGSNNNKAINSRNNTRTNNTNTDTNTTTTINNTNASATSFKNMTPQQQADVVWKKVQQIEKDGEALISDVRKKYAEIKKSNPDGCLDKNNPDHHYKDFVNIDKLLTSNDTLEYLDSEKKVKQIKDWLFKMWRSIGTLYVCRHKG